MSHQVNKEHINQIKVDIISLLSGKRIHPVDVMLALTELVGRTIVDVSTSPGQVDDLKHAAIAHINNTILYGAHATGKSIIERA